MASISIFIPFVYLLVKLWIEQWKIQFKDNDVDEGIEKYGH